MGAIISESGNNGGKNDFLSGWTERDHQGNVIREIPREEALQMLQKRLTENLQGEVSTFDIGLHDKASTGRKPSKSR